MTNLIVVIIKALNAEVNLTMRFNEIPASFKIIQTLSAFLVILLLLVFSGVFNNTFVIYDDPEYVTENANVLGGVTWNALKWSFTSFHNANWHPLTWFSHILDVQFYGLNPTGHHVTNLLLHIATTVLLFVVLNKMTGALWRSFATAVLFGIHPLHVESVAWIAERKDVLSGLLFMLTLWAYGGYASRPGVGRYLLVMVFFACGLMAKPMLVTLPLVLLLLDYWPLQRTMYSPVSEPSKHHSLLLVLLCEKIPFFVLSILSSIVTFLSQQRGGATPLLENAFHWANISNGLLSYTSYCLKLLWPQGLAVFYPRVDSNVYHVTLAVVAIVTLSISAVLVRKNYPFVCVGWFWFVCTLAPVIGFIRIGSSAMSDRYTYIPSIGFFIVICWLAGTIASRQGVYTKVMVAASLFVVVVILSVLTVKQIRYWNNSFSLFEHALDVTNGNWLANGNLAAAYLVCANNDLSLNLTHYLCSKNGGVSDATKRFNCLNKSIEASRAALQIKPDYSTAYFNLGVAYNEFGDRQSALNVLNKLKLIDMMSADRLEKVLTRH